MALRTVICDLLGVDHPVLLAGMGGVGGRADGRGCVRGSDQGGVGKPRSRPGHGGAARRCAGTPIVTAKGRPS